MSDDDSIVPADEMADMFSREITRSLLDDAQARIREITNCTQPATETGGVLDAAAAAEFEEVSRQMEAVAQEAAAVSPVVEAEPDWQQRCKDLEQEQTQLHKSMRKLIRMMDHMGAIGIAMGIDFPGLSAIAES